MNHLQTQSVKIQKIKKKTRNTKTGERSYFCGGCQKAYKSYPALYLHIKLKHKGIKPPNTYDKRRSKTAASNKLASNNLVKHEVDVDDIPEAVIVLEDVEDQLFSFFGDELDVISALEFKPTFENVVNSILRDIGETKDEYLQQIKTKIEEFFVGNQKNLSANRDMELDYETIKEKGPKGNAMILAWFILWFGKNTVKLEFMPDLCLIFSRVLKVLISKDLDIADLDNKIVWKEIYKECQLMLADLEFFKDRPDFLNEFLRKICQFIGKTFD